VARDHYRAHVAKLLCVLSELVDESPQSAKFHTRGRLRLSVDKGDEVLIRGLDGTTIGYATIAAALPSGRLLALALDGLTAKDVPLAAEVWVADGEHDSGPPTVRRTRNGPPGPEDLSRLPPAIARSPVLVGLSCPVCAAAQAAAPSAEAFRCAFCPAYLVVGPDETREVGRSELMPRSSLAVPFAVLGPAPAWPQLCASCAGPAVRQVDVPERGSLHEPTNDPVLDFFFRSPPTIRNVAPSFYDAGRAHAHDGRDTGWQVPQCDVDNRDHRDPAAVYVDDKILGFRCYAYYRAFCEVNGLFARFAGRPG
jgi:hypothetical protein